MPKFFSGLLASGTNYPYLFSPAGLPDAMLFSVYPNYRLRGHRSGCAHFLQFRGLVNLAMTGVDMVEREIGTSTYV